MQYAVPVLFSSSSKNAPRASILLIGKSSEWFLEALHEPTERRQTTSSLSHPIGVVQFRLDHFLRRFHRFAICTARRIEAKPTFDDFLIGPIFGFFAIDTQEQVKVIVHGAKAPTEIEKISLSSLRRWSIQSLRWKPFS